MRFSSAGFSERSGLLVTKNCGGRSSSSVLLFEHHEEEPGRAVGRQVVRVGLVADLHRELRGVRRGVSVELDLVGEDELEEASRVRPLVETQVAAHVRQVLRPRGADRVGKGALEGGVGDERRSRRRTGDADDRHGPRERGPGDVGRAEGREQLLPVGEVGAGPRQVDDHHGGRGRRRERRRLLCQGGHPGRVTGSVVRVDELKGLAVEDRPRHTRTAGARTTSCRRPDWRLA